MKRIGFHLTILVASLGAAACTGEVDSTQPTEPTDPGGTTGSPDNTFDHDNSGYRPWDLIDRLSQQGPPRFTSRVHSCAKVRVATLGNVLTSVGINVGNATMLSAGQLYTSGSNALGAPNYANRIRENIQGTTSGMSRMFDIFAAGADEIITAVPTLARCNASGAPAQLFDASNKCVAAGISCITGIPATQTHVDFCNLAVSGASDVATGKRLAVAAMMAAAYTCE
jgi:hypothetical protein